ncbi:MAG: DMT family transporter [Candidatus Heimdallarchaeaceae archaeon]
MEHKNIETSLFKQILPYLQLFIAILAVSFSAIIVVFLLDEGVAPEVTAMYRTFFTGIGALILSLPKLKIKWIGEKKSIKHFHWILLSGFFLAVHFATWFLSLNYVNVAISTTLVDTVPIFLAIFGFIFFKEKINVVGIIGIIIAFLGGVLLAFGSPTSDNTFFNLGLGIILSIIGALTVTFYFLIGKKILKDSPLWPYFALVNLSSALFLFIYNLIRGYTLFSYSSFVYLLFCLAAIGPSLIGHATYNYTLKKLPVFVVGVMILGEPIGATILSILFFPETQTPEPIIILFAGIILLGIVLTSISQYVKLPKFSKKEKKIDVI